MTTGPLKSSCNGGEFSRDVAGRIDIKQYYSAGLRFKNVEPVPQGGFRLMPGSLMIDEARSPHVKQWTLNVSPDLSYTFIITPGWVDIYRSDRIKRASLNIPALTLALLPQLGFYGEANTFGIFHNDLRSIRIARNPADDTIWTVDDWPYASIPEVDLGGTYTQVIDIWEVNIRALASSEISLSVTVNGESTPSIELQDALGDPATFGDASADWNAFADRIRDAINDLPSIPGGVTIGQGVRAGARIISIAFDGASIGEEYSLSAIVTNTSDASALAVHTQIGRTDGEPLVSTSKGWFSGMDLVQDRATYFAPKARRAALAMSRIAEYFDLNIRAQGDNAARLEALRTQTSEAVLAVYEGKYMLVFTDKSEWFATNRTFSRNEPVNFVRASSNGIRPNCPPVEIEGQVYFVSGGNTPEGEDERRGQVLYSASYDDVSTSYNANPESLLASHLVGTIDGSALQQKNRNIDAPRWLMKDEDGRLISALVIRNQDIPLAMCQWVAALNGQVKGLSVDGQNQVWITVQRGSVITTEVMEDMTRNLFQGAVRGSTDLAGQFAGLDRWNGQQVWARADGFILGPFTVSGGAIDLGDPYDDVVAGLWQPPVFESMPYVRVLPNDEIQRRPGRVHSVKAYVIDTESIAIGANGSRPRDISLLSPQDPTDAPMPAKSRYVEPIGIPGMVMDPTVVISQTRPGMLRVRDYVPGVKL
ncbi:hypothetical protein D5400_11740 [Georhizobium profundi]|uniref:Uncharacterized protein n=1 Tax=Georhizobium profundi TaxID=2341112 RepID=A0A3S9B4J2_9HYPH|nr:hypothetical protein [Georhizobium profundi]AZN71860.1 hypothetical protein D5400_11740 [Georhizobium profundi]